MHANSLGVYENDTDGLLQVIVRRTGPRYADRRVPVHRGSDMTSSSIAGGTATQPGWTRPVETRRVDRDEGS